MLTGTGETGERRFVFGEARESLSRRFHGRRRFEYALGHRPTWKIMEAV